MCISSCWLTHSYACAHVHMCMWPCNCYSIIKQLIEYSCPRYVHRTLAHMYTHMHTHSDMCTIHGCGLTHILTQRPTPTYTCRSIVVCLIERWTGYSSEWQHSALFISFDLCNIVTNTTNFDHRTTAVQHNTSVI